jgi:RNA polymerase sigma-70 factor (ECF subfamily)
MAQAPAPAWAPRPDDAASLREAGRDVDQAIEGLPDKYRLVLWLSDVEGHKLDDVAEVLGITLPTVKARLLRARAVIRQSVGKRRRPTPFPRPSP